MSEDACRRTRRFRHPGGWPGESARRGNKRPAGPSTRAAHAGFRSGKGGSPCPRDGKRSARCGGFGWIPGGEWFPSTRPRVFSCWSFTAMSCSRAASTAIRPSGIGTNKKPLGKSQLEDCTGRRTHGSAVFAGSGAETQVLIPHLPMRLRVICYPRQIINADMVKPRQCIDGLDRGGALSVLISGIGRLGNVEQLCRCALRQSPVFSQFPQMVTHSNAASLCFECHIIDTDIPAYNIEA